MKLRSRLALSGGLGIAGGAALMGGALLLLRGDSYLGPFVGGLGTWLLLGFLLFFSLVEIPVMIYGMRRMIGGVSGERLAILVNAAFTFFAAVYAVPFLLLTGRLKIGLALAGLGLLRYSCALWFVSGGAPGLRDSQASMSSERYLTSSGEEL